MNFVIIAQVIFVNFFNRPVSRFLLAKKLVYFYF